MRAYLVIALILLAIAPAHADTDYQCLNKCVSGGKQAATCMTDCTYNVVPIGSSLPGGVGIGTSAPKATTTLKNHRVFSTPLPDSGQIKLDPPKSHVETPSKDWACMKTCLAQATPYSACEKNCTMDSATQILKTVNPPSATVPPTSADMPRY